MIVTLGELLLGPIWKPAYRRLVSFTDFVQVGVPLLLLTYLVTSLIAPPVLPFNAAWHHEKELAHG